VSGNMGATTFDDQPAFQTGEIRHIGAHGMLTPEFPAFEPAATEQIPKAAFGIRELLA